MFLQFVLKSVKELNKQTIQKIKDFKYKNGKSRKIENDFFLCSVWAKVVIKIPDKCIDNEDSA